MDLNGHRIYGRLLNGVHLIRNDYIALDYTHTCVINFGFVESLRGCNGTRIIGSTSSGKFIWVSYIARDFDTTDLYNPLITPEEGQILIEFVKNDAWLFLDV